MKSREQSAWVWSFVGFILVAAAVGLQWSGNPVSIDAEMPVWVKVGVGAFGVAMLFFNPYRKKQ